MTTSEFLNHIDETYMDCGSIVQKKNADYATGDDPFANFKAVEILGLPVEQGILVRTLDKIVRINNLLTKEPSVANESLEDSVHDVINYMAILKAYRASKQQTLASAKLPVDIEAEAAKLGSYANDVIDTFVLGEQRPTASKLASLLFGK